MNDEKKNKQESLQELENWYFGRGLIQPQKHKKNPFRSKPIPKSKIECFIQNTRSIDRSKFLGVSYNTFKKYFKMYDLFEQNKNVGLELVLTKVGIGLIPRKPVIQYIEW